MNMLKVTNAAGTLVSYVNPSQVLFIQVFQPPKRADKEDEPMALGEVVAPGGAFRVYRQDEMDDICEAFKIEQSPVVEAHLTIEG